MKMSYQIILKNNDTGEVSIDEEIVGLCGAIQKTDTETGILLITECNLIEYCAMLKGAQSAILKAKLQHPEAAMFVEMTRKREATGSEEGEDKE
jgi:hypothetical protein